MDAEWKKILPKIIKIVYDETGNQLTEKNYPMIQNRLLKRFSILGIKEPASYLDYLEKNLVTEKRMLISCATTHHTFFFREYFHFEDIEYKLINNILNHKKDKTIKIWSAACSLGQEAYSLAMFFNKLKTQNKLKDFDYKILGTDVDYESVQYAQNSVYEFKELSQVPLYYVHGNWLRGKGELSSFVKPKSHIKNSITFEVANLLKLDNQFTKEKFDIIFCRNVLIYFNQQQVSQIINSLLSRLSDYGIMVLGISESILGYNLPVNLVSNSIYCHKNFDFDNKEKAIVQELPKKSIIKILCVDDSPTILMLLKKILKKDKGFEVVGTALNAQEARSILKTLDVDIITLDIHMPGETGIEYLRKDFKKGIHPPVLIVSSVERDGTNVVKEALDLGASDYVEKPDIKNISDSEEEICFKIDTIFKQNSNNRKISKNLSNETALPSNTSILHNDKNNSPIKVLIVDDSPTIRMQLKNMLSKDKRIKVVGEVSDPRDVKIQVQNLQPDVLTLDINMPYLNGIDVLKIVIPEFKIPTIVVSALNMEEGSLVMEALETGAIDFFQKPQMKDIESESLVLIEKIINAKSSKISNLSKYSFYKNNNEEALDKNYIIAIGSSTGGTEALKIVLERLPENIPPIVVVQHIPEVFSKALADRLNNICSFHVVEASHDLELLPNTVYIAPGNKQMKVIKQQSKFKIDISTSDLVNGHRPSVDVLFSSIADLNLKKSLGVILTGMGNDGAKGLKKMKASGSKTIAQDEATCVVFGMPKEAIKLNAVDFIEPIDNVANKIITLTKTISH